MTTSNVVDVIKVGDRYFDSEAISQMKKRIDGLLMELGKTRRELSTANHYASRVNKATRLMDALVDMVEDELDERYERRSD